MPIGDVLFEETHSSHRRLSNALTPNGSTAMKPSKIRLRHLAMRFFVTTCNLSTRRKIDGTYAYTLLLAAQPCFKN